MYFDLDFATYRKSMTNLLTGREREIIFKILL